MGVTGIGMGMIDLVPAAGSIQSTRSAVKGDKERRERDEVE